MGTLEKEDLRAFIIEAKAHTNAGERRERAEVAARVIRDGAMSWAQQR